MRIVIFLLLLSSIANGQIINGSSPYRVTTAGASCPFIISSWASSFNLTESPTGIWGPINYAVDGNGEALSSVSLSGNGYIQAEFNSSVNESTAIFLSTTASPTSPYYANVAYGLYVSAGGEYYSAVSGSYTALGVNAASGDLFRVIRTGTTIKGQYYRSGTWTDLVTYGTYAGTLYIGASSANPGNAVYLRNPKYCNE